MTIFFEKLVLCSSTTFLERSLGAAERNQGFPLVMPRLSLGLNIKTYFQDLLDEV
jgi:hypothetical protein